MTQQIFSDEINRIENEIALAQRLDTVNSKLQNLNWIFLHPYNQGGDVEVLERICQEENAGEKITHFFAYKFFDLRATIHFIDGLYKKRPFLKDYADSIEESVILCIQKDFKGAINTLLPVIEGTLRKYLVSKNGDSKKNVIKISELLKSIDSLTEDYLLLQKKYLLQRYNAPGVVIHFDLNQENRLMDKRREYFELWMKQLKRYLENNLYLDTRKSEVKDTFNRHFIFHALEDNIDFSFSNYLRLFNCISFLSWAIGSVNDDCSILSVANEQDVMNKWADYLKVLAASEALTETKSNLFGREIESFKKYLPKEYLPIIKRPEAKVKEALRVFDFFKDMDEPKSVLSNLSKTRKFLMFYWGIKRAKNVETI